MEEEFAFDKKSKSKRWLPLIVGIALLVSGVAVGYIVYPELQKEKEISKVQEQIDSLDSQILWIDLKLDSLKSTGPIGRYANKAIPLIVTKDSLLVKREQLKKVKLKKTRE